MSVWSESGRCGTHPGVRVPLKESSHVSGAMNGCARRVVPVEWASRAAALGQQDKERLSLRGKLGRSLIRGPNSSQKAVVIAFNCRLRLPKTVKVAWYHQGLIGVIIPKAGQSRVVGCATCRKSINVSAVIV